jgi:REP element-mobilizing transposase RayT
MVTMSNPPRKIFQDVTYHVFTRCIELKNHLSHDYAKRIAVDVLADALEIYSFELVHFEFVENHMHLLIRTVKNGQTISRIMQYIKARIAERFNRLNNRTGPFWNERFGCEIIEHAQDPIEYFCWLLWYIAYNPVRKRVIRDPRESKYGTIRAYLEENYKPVVKIKLHHFFHELGKTFEDKVNRILEYEEEYRNYLAGKYKFLKLKPV